MGRFTDAEIASIADSLRLDRAAAEVVSALSAAGVPTVLLKGRALARMLYPDAPRTYWDIDVLVPAPMRAEAEEVLAGLGFARKLEQADEPAWIPKHASDWIRDDVPVDLHHTLRNLGAPPPAVWAALERRAVAAEIGGAPCRVLDPAGMALNVAVHAAARGIEVGKPIDDLRRAVDRLPGEDWHAAADLAGEVGGTAALAAGLRTIPAGAELAWRLGVAEAVSVESSLDAAAAPVAAHGIEQVARARGARARAGILARAVFPSPAFMRVASPLARRGAGGLGLAYARRPLWLAAHAPGAIAAWLRARRAVRASGATSGASPRD